MISRVLGPTNLPIPRELGRGWWGSRWQQGGVSVGWLQVGQGWQLLQPLGDAHLDRQLASVMGMRE